MPFIVMRKPSLPTDDDRDVPEGQYESRTKAQNWIDAQAGKVFPPSHYYIRKIAWTRN